MRRPPDWLAGLAAVLALAIAPATGGAAPQVVTGTPLAAAGAAVIDLGAIAATEPPTSQRPRGTIVAPAPRSGPLGQSVPVDALPPAGPGAAAPAGSSAPVPTLPSPAPVAGFVALDDDDTSIPPDTHGAAGPGHLVVALNSSVRVQTRAGAPLLTVPLATFWAAVGPFANGPFDPRVLYDPIAGRWIMSATADTTLPGASLLVGASRTGDPTGLWNLYRFDADPANLLWPDFPALGFNASWIVVTANMYDNADNFVEPDVYVFPKAAVYAGAPVAPTRFAAVSGAGVGFALAPASTHDASADMPLVEDWNGNFQGKGFLRFSRLTGPAGAPVLTLDVAFPAAPDPWASSVPGGVDFAPQLFSPHKIQVNDARIGANCVRRAAAVWCTQEVLLPANAPTRVAVQWWQLNATTGVVVQVGRVDDPSGQRSFIYPSIAANAAGDVLVGYSRLSATQFASANYAFRAAGDPANTLRADTVLKEGEAALLQDVLRNAEPLGGLQRHRGGPGGRRLVLDDPGVRGDPAGRKRPLGDLVGPRGS